MADDERPDLDPVDDTIALELEFLTSLIWAPDSVTVIAVHALVGTAIERALGPDQVARADVLPLDTTLFIRRDHALVFAAVVARVDGALPVTPTLLAESLSDPKARASVRNVLLEIGAPTGQGPLPGGADVPHLAIAVVDHWYRRGYIALVSKMALACEESPTDDLADRWADLTAHQQRAHRRRSEVRRRLAQV
ncbi:hypothetical protein [Gordonia sp. MP11Mi]|uniref:Uncharacterized protein n=1 Tax=Gordonia sp. MP11Mi TaxID=3022769 RepID=A0AA97CTS0_9ACTN